MKKFIVCVLLFICIFGAAGCRMPLRKQSVAHGVSHSDLDTLAVKIEGLCFYPDKTTLMVSWSITGEHKISCGESFGIERFGNGTWVDCSIQTNIFTLIGYSLAPNETTKKEYLLTDRYDISLPGTYRFCADCGIMDAADNAAFSVWAEFVIE